MRRRRRNRMERGQATLEFLILVPLIFAMITLIVFAGWWSYSKLSAQNAAYSWTIFNAKNRPTWEGGGRAGNIYAQIDTLHSSEGMKELWGDSIAELYVHSEYKHWRRGGTGVTISISPRDLTFEDVLRIIDATITGDDSIKMPKGNAFFHYGPFNSANQ